MFTFLRKLSLATSPEQWLGLRDAAQRLGVHETTLRRWADMGEIPVMVTPGGHRRFSAADLDRFAEERRRLRVVAGIEQVWAEQALQQTRQALQAQRDDAWINAYDEAERTHKRELGQRLLKVLLQYLSQHEGSDSLLDQARLIGQEHAANSRQRGMSLTETLKIVLFFRDMLFGVTLSLPEVAQVKAETNAQMLRRIDKLLSVVELAVVEVYDQAQA